MVGCQGRAQGLGCTRESRDESATPAGVDGQGCRREQRLWQMLWSACPGVGVVRIAQLEREFTGLEAAWWAPCELLASRCGWSALLLHAVEAYRRSWGSDPLAQANRRWRGGRGVLVPGDGSWPSGLTALQRPPLWLHWQGRGSLWPLLARRAAIAVVGTRQPSAHGLRMAHRIGAQLAAHGWPVVSGLAEGVDAAAHEGCLAAQGAPVAVLGTPVQRVYPSHHRQLQGRVGRQGLLVSEWPAGAPVRPGHFASRNRLLVALAAAVVVVECPEESGALLSAELAWSLGLPLWAVPGDAGRTSSLGSNLLLCRGATPLVRPSDLTDQLGPGPLIGRPAHTGERRGASPRPGSPEALVLGSIDEEASLETLQSRLNLPDPLLSTSLLQLELAGLVEALPGLCWRRC
jgi:DNA processing protein